MQKITVTWFRHAPRCQTRKRKNLDAGGGGENDASVERGRLAMINTRRYTR